MRTRAGGFHSSDRGRKFLVGGSVLVLSFVVLGGGFGCSDDASDASGGTGGTAAGGGGSGGSAGMAGASGTGGAAGMAGAAGAGGQLAPACKPPEAVPDPWDVTFMPYNWVTTGFIDGVLLEVFRSDGTLLESGTTGMNGEVSMSIPTGGKPIDGYVTASKDGYLRTRVRIQGGLGWLDRWATVMASEAFADSFVAQTWTFTSRDPNAALVVLWTADCNKGSASWGLREASIAFEPASKGVFYYGGTSTKREGLAIAANVPAGDNTITVSLDGTDTAFDRPMLANTLETMMLYPKATPDCRPADTSGYTPAWKPSNGVAQGLCTDQQAEGYVAACLGPSAHKVGCDAWKADAANADCVDCAEANADDPNRNGIVQFDPVGFYDRDTGSCISAFEGDLTEASCGAKLQAAMECFRAACEAGCLIEGDSLVYDVARFDECKNEAAEGDCSTYWGEAKACTDSLVGNGDPVDQCVWKDGIDNLALVAERTIMLLCGDGSAVTDLMGRIQDSDGNKPEGVDVCWYDNDAVPCVTSGWEGTWVLEGMPLGEQGAVKMSMAGLVETYWWSVGGFEKDGLTYPLLTAAESSKIYQDVSETEDATLGMLSVRASDKNFAPVAGSRVTISATSASGPHYFTKSGILEAGATSSSGGTTRYLRVAPGDVEVRVMSESGKECRAAGFVVAGPRTFQVFANADTEAVFVCD